MGCIIKYNNNKFSMEDVIQDMASKFTDTNLTINTALDSKEYGAIISINKLKTNDTNNIITNEITSAEKVDVGEQAPISEEVGKGNAKEEITKETQEKENPLNLDVQSLPKDIAGRKEAIKAKLKNDGILVIEDENGNPC